MLLKIGGNPRRVPGKMDPMPDHSGHLPPAEFERMICKYVANVTKGRPLPTAARQRILQRLAELQKQMAQPRK